MLLGVSGIALIVSALQQFNSVDQSPAVASVPTVLSATLDSGSTSTTDTSLGEEPSLSEEPKDLATMSWTPKTSPNSVNPMKTWMYSVFAEKTEDEATTTPG